MHPLELNNIYSTTKVAGVFSGLFNLLSLADAVIGDLLFPPNRRSARYRRIGDNYGWTLPRRKYETDTYKFPYKMAPFSSKLPRNVPPYVIASGKSVEGRILTEAEKRVIDKYKALANAPKPQNFAQGYLPGIMSGIGINTEAEKRLVDKYKALANAPKPQNFAQGYLPGIMSGIGINTEAEKRLVDKYKALYRAKTTKGFTQGYLPGFEPPKAMVPKGKGIGFWGPLSGAIMAWFLWPYIKEFAYGIGLGQPITAAQQSFSGKPIDWGTLRDPAVEHYFDTQYRMINPQF